MFNTSKKIIISIIILLFFFSIFLFFWKYSPEVHETNLTSLKYEEIKKNIALKKITDLKKEEKFVIENNNIYGTLTAMLLAKKYVLYNDFNKAFNQLKNSLKYTKDENLKNILQLRMTQIAMQQYQNKKAINILKNIKNRNWKNIVERMKGDVFMNQKKTKKAIKHWEKSLSIEKSNASKEIINMKINELK